MEPIEFRFVGDVQRLVLKPGDALVLKCKGRISTEIAERIRSAVKAEFPGAPVIVIDEGVTDVLVASHGVFA